MGGVFLLILIIEIVSASSYSNLPITKVNAGSQPVSTSNPLLDPVSLQLQTWSENHPQGSNLRATDFSGIPVPSLTSSLSVGNQGPLLLDPKLIEKLANFNRERIPERPVHASGMGAFGHFLVTNDISRYTKAKFLNTVGKITEIFVRFSKVSARTGDPETVPNGRGFAIKFYTEDGINDFAGFQAPIFNSRDPMQFPSFRSFDRQNPVTNLSDPAAFAFFSRCETIHTFIRARSDIVFAKSLRAIDGHAVNTYKCVNSKKETVWCKFQWRSWQQMGPLNDTEIRELSGRDPYYYSKDLYNAIATGDYPKWTLGLQIMTAKQAKELPFDPFDPTKLWKEAEFPFIPVGAFVLNANPTDYFTQVEQSAFSPSNIVPGIEASLDKTLLARMATYKDAQRARLGTNFHQIEVNRPKSPVNSYSRDGAMKLSAVMNRNGGPNYFPNSFNGPTVDTSVAEVPFKVSGTVDRYDTGNDDNFSQPRDFLNEIGPEERSRIAERCSRALVNVLESVRAEYIKCHYQISKEWGDEIVLAIQQRLLENSRVN